MLNQHQGVSAIAKATDLSRQTMAAKPVSAPVSI